MEAGAPGTTVLHAIDVFHTCTITSNYRISKKFDEIFIILGYNLQNKLSCIKGPAFIVLIFDFKCKPFLKTHKAVAFEMGIVRDSSVALYFNFTCYDQQTTQ